MLVEMTVRVLGVTAHIVSSGKPAVQESNIPQGNLPPPSSGVEGGGRREAGQESRHIGNRLSSFHSMLRGQVGRPSSGLPASHLH